MSMMVVVSSPDNAKLIRQECTIIGMFEGKGIRKKRSVQVFSLFLIVLVFIRSRYLKPWCMSVQRSKVNV